MALGSLHHLSLVVSDRTQSERFYDQVLGFLGYRQVESNGEFTLWWSAQAGGVSITALPGATEPSNYAHFGSLKDERSQDSNAALQRPLISHFVETASESGQPDLKELNEIHSEDLFANIYTPPDELSGSPEDRLRKSLGLYHVAFSAESQGQVDELYQLLMEIGANVISPPAVYDHYAPGYYAVFFTDPDGIRMEVVHMPVLP